MPMWSALIIAVDVVRIDRLYKVVGNSNAIKDLSKDGINSPTPYNEYTASTNLAKTQQSKKPNMLTYPYGFVQTFPIF